MVVFTLVFALILLSSCKRNGVEEPSPFGPTSIAVVLKLNASPNVLFAGTTHKASTITASLKKYDGVPLNDKTVHFEITDNTGAKVNAGYFDGNESVKSRDTDSNGNATVTYYGPLADDLAADTTIYIQAKVAWDGKQFVSSIARIDLVRDVTDAIFEISANPNLLSAGMYRKTSAITATLKTAAGEPIVNKTVHFEITDSDGAKLNLGYFDNMESVKSVSTDATGTATVTYFGPIDQEITENTTVYIIATVSSDGDTSVSVTAAITVIRDVTSITLDVSAYPDVLYAGTERGESAIYATLKTAEGTPLADRTIHFEVTDSSGNQLDVGYFEGNQIVRSGKTDENGMATVTYYGPLRDEISSSTDVYIKVYASTEGKEAVTAQSVKITVIREGTSVSLNVSANPNAITAGETRETSTISALIKTADGSSLSGQSIVFEICSDSAGATKVDTGYFEDNQAVFANTTDENGLATVIYYGPLASEITQNTTVYIKATLAWEGSTVYTDTTPISIIWESATPTISLSIDPNVMSVGTTYIFTDIVATAKMAGGEPIANKDVVFEIVDSSGNRLNVGWFENWLRVMTKTTDAAGNILIYYWAPLSSQITSNTTVYIKATLAWEGSTTYSATASISIIRQVP